jgi:HlyD family secretion protein
VADKGGHPVKKLLLLLVLIGLGLAGVAYWINQSGVRPVTPDIFTYAEVTRGPMVESISATGSLRPRGVIVVSSPLPGQVIEVPPDADINAELPQGALLVKLDPSDLKLKLAQAQAGVQTAEAAVEQAKAAEVAAHEAVKYQLSIGKAGGPRGELLHAQAQEKAAAAGVKLAQARVLAARAAVDEATHALTRTEIRIPARAGEPGPPRRYLVLDRKVRRGQMVGPTLPTPLFTLARSLARMEVHAEVAEADIGPVRKGLAATFTVSTYGPETKFRGTVRQIRPLPSNVKGAIFYATVIEVENRKDPGTGEWMLRPGMTAAVDLVAREKKAVWKVPTAALNFSLEEAYQTAEVKARLEQWRQRSDWEDWRPVWIWDAGRKTPWPVLVRIAGGKDDQPGLKDLTYNEVLEWEPGAQPSGEVGPRVIINAPPARRPGLFDQPANIKLS